MKQLKDEAKTTRKKVVMQNMQTQSKILISTPNFKYDFLMNSPGDLVIELRKLEIDAIVDNLKLITSSQLSTCKKAKTIMLILGSPGTGKTSSINQSLNLLKNYCKQNYKQLKHIHKLKIITFNANALRKCEQIMKQLQKIRSENKQGKKQQQRRIKCLQYEINAKGGQIINIVYVQQIDQIFINNSQAILGQFCELFNQYAELQANQQHNKYSNKYLLIGASNSINLDQKLQKKVDFLKNQKIFTKIFTQYSSQNLLKISMSKLDLIKEKLNIEIKVPQKILKYIINKLQENKREDTRYIIQIIKQLAIYAQARPEVQKSWQQSKAGVVQIGLEEVHAIGKIKTMITNTKIGIIEKLNYKQQIILTILYRFFKNNDDLEMPYLQIVQEFKKLQTNAGIVAYEDVHIAVSQLQTYGCIKIKSSNKIKNSSNTNRSNSAMSILLKVSFSDIYNSLSSNPILAKYLQP